MKIESATDFIKRKNLQFKKDLIESNSVGMKDIGRKGKNHFLREAWTFLVQSNFKYKVFILERLTHFRTEGHLAYGKREGNEFEYRIGYYIVGKIRKAKNKWIWGQFCPMIPRSDLVKLINKAKKEKTII